MVRAAALMALCSALCAAQGTEPKQKPAEYTAHVQAGDATVGVEYMVRTFLHRGQSIYVNDYLLVEVAVFPPADGKVMVRSSDFKLRVNGKNQLLFPQTPGMVAASLKYPDWAGEREVTASAGTGDRAVILGRGPRVARFPGDPRPEASRLPGRLPPAQTTPDGVPQREELDINELVASAALPEGEIKFPVSGYLFFRWPSKLSKLKKVELLITTASGGVVVARLR